MMDPFCTVYNTCTLLNMSIRNIYSLKDQGLQASPEQGSQEWLDGRKGRITGSKPSDLYFNFKQESDWDDILEKWFGNRPSNFDDVAKSRMAWGSKHEASAIDVIVDNIPNSYFFDCPMIPIDDIYAASPDGGLVVLKEDGSTNWWANIEIKCPAGGIGKTAEEMKAVMLKKWKTPAPYYMMQIHQEMASQKTSETLFVVWTPLLTRMWRIPFNRSFWNLCLEITENFRLKNVPFEVMSSKIQMLKRRCFGVSNFPIWKEVHHANTTEM